MSGDTLAIAPPFRAGHATPLYLRADVAVLAYFIGMFVANMFLMITADNSYFRIAQVGFGVILVFLMMTTNLVPLVLRQLFGNWGGLCLVGFLSYYAIATLGHPTPSVTDEHLRYLVVSIAPALAAGIVAFAPLRVPLRELRNVPGSFRRFCGSVVRLPVLGVYVCATVGTVMALQLFRRSDVFLVDLSETGLRLYQVFGTYAFLAHATAAAIWLRRYRETPPTTRRFVVFVVVQAMLAAVVTVSMALMGSNKEPVALVMMFALLVAYAKPDAWLLKGDRIRLSSLIVLAIAISGIVIAGGLVLTTVELPPLRIFDFGKAGAGSILENRSLASRIELLMGTGVDQLSLNPLFGELAAEHLTIGSGRYIHSLLSIQSHLGLIGTLTMTGFLAHRFHRLYGNPGGRALKMIAPPVMFIALVATFFTWEAFWFLVGALAIWQPPAPGRPAV